MHAYIHRYVLNIWNIADEVPVPSYVLCVGYFINWTMSVVLMLGLILVILFNLNSIQQG